jgi:DNA-binding response OmpR family regulator
MKLPSAPSIRITIVDSAPQDYVALLAAADAPGVSIHFLSSGNDALRFARRCHSELWVINSQLPDMSGFDLAEMLRSVRRSTLVFLIGDEYRLDDEMQALTLGLAKYLCKPLEPSWVLPHRRDFCIPLPRRRNLSRPLRIVTPAEYDEQEYTVEVLPLPPAREEEGEDQVILPFNPALRQRPAA